MHSPPRTACRNSSTCCIPAQPDSPSSWTDWEKVRMFLTTLLDTGSVTWMETCRQHKLRKMTCLFQTHWCWLILFFFNTQTCVSCCCQPLLHLWDSLVSVWANVGSPPGFLPYPCTPPPSRSPPSRCCESLWCHRALLIPFCAPLTDRLCSLSWTKPTMPRSGLFLTEATGRCFPKNPSSELYWEKRSRSPLVLKEAGWSFKPFKKKRRTCVI